MAKKLYFNFEKRSKSSFSRSLNRSKVWPKSGYASVRPFMYFDHFHIFDLLCILTHRLFFDLNLTSTYLANLYFDQNCTSTCASRPIRSPDLTKGRTKEVEVEQSKYRKSRDMKMVEIQKRSN